MIIRKREDRIVCKDVAELLGVGSERAKVHFRRIRVFAKKERYAIVTFGDYLEWLDWFNTHSPKERKEFYRNTN